MIQQAVESSRAATSNALRQLDENIAVNRLGGSGFATRARGETLMQGEQRTAQLPFELIQQFITTALGQATGTPTTIVQGLGAASESQSRLQAANTQAFAQMLSSLMSAGGMVGGGLAV